MLPYGSESRELTNSVRISRKSNEHSWKRVAVGATLTVMGVGYCATLHSMMNQQAATLSSMQQQMSSMSSHHSADVINPFSVKGKAAPKPTQPSSQPASPLPHKFAVDNVTPRKTQDLRGTCWDFATISVLEYTYRQQGIANGWLAPDTYVSLSEQAYGADLLRLCTSVDKNKCYLTATQNTTEGGFVLELPLISKDVSIFPDAVCPYVPGPGSDTVCPGQTAETKKTNPLKVTVNKYSTLIDADDIKRALVSEKRAMALSTEMAVLTHYKPCVGELTKDPRCDVASPQCTLCPPNSFQTACCIRVGEGEDYNMDGEFIAHYGMEAEGGHAMTIVGYNDNYRTQDGATGGYILKNSWWDGVDPALGPKHARGSHSIRYWLQTITAFEERASCPNSANPNNWYACQGSTGVIQTQKHSFASTGTRSVVANATQDMCLTEETRLDAVSQISPLKLRCLDKSKCDPSLTYFTRNLTSVGDHFNVLCLFEYNATKGATSHDVCFPPMLLMDIAHTIQPVEAEIRANDPDHCGFYFYPYEKQLAQYQRGWEMTVDDLDVTWDPQSYAANAAKYPHLDYFLIKASTKKQKPNPVSAPFAIVGV